MSLFKKMYSFRSFLLKLITYRAEIRNINRKENLWSRVELTPEQETEIQSYWSGIYGKQISSKWHRLYQSYMGVFDKRYFPEILYSTKLERLLSPEKYNSVLADKYLITSIFKGGGYKTPVTFVANTSGVFTNSQREVISQLEAKSILENIGACVMKPTIDTSSGQNVMILDMKDGKDVKTGMASDELFRKYKQNYIVQERIEQSDVLNKLYPKALNTFRVVTYICEGKVYCAPVALRIGRGGAEVDNIHAGGITIGIDNNCCLRKYAFTEMGDRFEKHPDTGVAFEGYKITKLQDIKELAKRLHGRIPMIKMISWDWTIDSNETPVLIETNLSGQSVWFPQMVNGEPFFGDNTPYFANLIR